MQKSVKKHFKVGVEDLTLKLVRLRMNQDTKVICNLAAREDTVGFILVFKNFIFLKISKHFINNSFLRIVPGSETWPLPSRSLQC